MHSGSVAPVAYRGKVHLEGQCLYVVIIRYIGCVEFPFVVQNVNDKTQPLGMVGLWWGLHRLFTLVGRHIYAFFLKKGPSALYTQ